MTDWLRESALRLIREHKIPYTLTRNAMWYDGRRISAGPKIKPHDILHEAAHWLLSPSDLRGVVNYGLGQDPDGSTPNHIESPELIHDDSQEEVLASAAGALLFAMIGGRFKDVLIDHQWGHNLRKDEVADVHEAAERLDLAGFKVPRQIRNKVIFTLAGMRGQHKRNLTDYSRRH